AGRRATRNARAGRQGPGSSADGHESPGAFAGEAGTVARRRPRVQYVGDPYYEDRGDTTVLVQEFRLPVPGPQRVRIDLAVTLPGTGGRETDPPIGAVMPVLVGWQDETGRLHADDPCSVEGGESLWRAVVRPAPDTMTEIGIKVEAVREPCPGAHFPIVHRPRTSSRSSRGASSWSKAKSPCRRPCRTGT